MSKKFFLKGLFAAVLSLSIATIFGSSASYAEAVITRGLFTDSNDVRWEWQKTIDVDNEAEPEKVSVMFYDKPAAITEIVVPSLSDVITAASASESLDTYYVRNANQTSQDEYFTSETRRDFGSNVTKLDMTNTSKVQVMGIKPILNAETEAELVFGENMVISDSIEIVRTTTVNVCRPYYSSWGSLYCDGNTNTEVVIGAATVPNWEGVPTDHKLNYTIEELGYYWYKTIEKAEDISTDPNVHYYYSSNPTITTNVSGEGVFEGYKLKLTGLENIKYLGWYTFRNATFSEDSREITISENMVAGEGTFENTNVNKVTFNGNIVYPAMFKGCADLTAENIILNNVETIGYSAFENTNLGSMDFSGTNVKTILGQAFKNTHITELNMGNIEKLGFEAFADNDITELDFPKSIRELTDGRVFINNNNLDKITVRFDTYQKTLPYRLSSIIGCQTDNSDCEIFLSELNVIAPYAEDEPVSNNHGAAPVSNTSYDSESNKEGFYRHGTFYNDYFNGAFNPGNIKNVIAGSFFDGFSMKKLVVGDGYEFIGNSAFFTYRHCRSANDILEEVVLPDSVKGIGAHAFEEFFNANPPEPEYYGGGTSGYIINHKHIAFEFPKNLITIGNQAFYDGTSLYATFDLPDLECIGEHAFENTNINDIVFHNKLVSVGYNAFYYYTYVSSHPYNSQIIREGKRNVVFDSQLALYYAGIDMYYYPMRQAFGKIVFTENISNLYMQNQSDRNTFIYGATFDEIDMSKSSIKNLPDKAFSHISVGKLTLPENLETIGMEAFYGVQIDEELVLPETLISVGRNAFNAAFNTSHSAGASPFSGGRGIEAENKLGVKITKLPKSLQAIEHAAFYGDVEMTAEIDLPNLTRFEQSAFIGTSITKIHWYKNNGLNGYAFGGNYYLKEVVLDTLLDGIQDLRDMIGGPMGFNYQNEYLNSNKTISDLHYDSIKITGDITSIPRKMNTRSRWIPGYYDDDGNFVRGYYEYEDYQVGGFFYGVNADVIDLSETTVKELPKDCFNKTTIKSLLLPDTLEEIGEGAFYEAKITDELILSDSIKKIGTAAFNNQPYVYSSNGGEDKTVGTIINLTKLPASLEEVGVGAFFGAYWLNIDLDLPNLKSIGQAAFMKTSLKNITLHDSIDKPIFSSAFSNIETMETLTIDYDFYRYNNTGAYISEYEELHTSNEALDFFAIFNRCGFFDYPGEGIFFFDSDSSEVQPYTNVIFTEKATTEPTEGFMYLHNFAKLSFDKLDLSKTPWKQFNYVYAFQDTNIGELLLPEGLETIDKGAFYGATIEEPVVMPATIKEIEPNAFELSKMTIVNGFAEGLTTIGASAFYGAEISGDLVIPSTVASIGWSAFNAGDTDTNYGTVTIKPALNYDSTESQAVFQLFWNAKMNKLVIESPMLPVLATTGENPVLPHEIQYQTVTSEGLETITINPTLRADGEPEFHGMTMKEVEIKNLPIITANAFEECGNLEKVSFANHDALAAIEHHTFNNDTKLKTFVFGNGLEGKEVVLGTLAFNNTAIETIGEDNTDFDLTAANFNANATYVFSNLPALRSVSVPNNFSGKTIPAYTFANDPELAEANIAWELETVDNGAFNNDIKLAKLFVWGNANINEDTDLTIPEQTTIFGYSDAPSEAYANNASRDNYDGKFYALDEVLYLTTNKTYVVLNEDKDDFDKTDLKLYALRRDGVILESDDWQEYTTAFPRSTANINFEEGRGALGDDSANIAAIVYDAPKPFNAISLTNQNFANVDFEFITMPSSTNPLVLINYPDGYTGNIRTATLASMTKEEEEEYLAELEVPNTGSAFLNVVKTATPVISIVAIVLVGGLVIVRKRH